MKSVRSDVAVQAKTSPHLPSVITVDLERALRVCVMRLMPPIDPTVTRYGIDPANAPTDAQRRALSIRRDNLDRWLAPAGLDEANKAYANLVAVMATKNVDDATAIREMQGWVTSTAALPLFALTTACEAFRDGKIGDGEWMPKPGQVCIEAGKRVAAYARERREIDSVLKAEIRVATSVRSRKVELLAAAASFVSGHRMAAAGASRGGMTPEEIADAKALSAAIATGTRDPRPMPKMSPYLRASLGLPPSSPASHDAPPSDMVPDGFGTENAA